jgi:hypothetical protein
MGRMAVHWPETLAPRTTSGASVTRLDAHLWRLAISAGPAGRYRLAQLDDYAALPRRQLPWQPPFTLALRARASASSLPGTWGFGLWNDPFGFSLGFGGNQRLPALPNTAWFFFASPENYLSLRDDLPSSGPLAASFRSPHWPAWRYVLAAPLLPLLALPFMARPLRRLGRRTIHQDATSLALDPADWHTCRLDWEIDQVNFSLDGLTVLQTPVSPLGPLGLVLWIDNQYAALPPNGRLAYSTLANPELAWVEIEALLR